MPGRKATWDEIDERVNAFPEKDREDVRRWVAFRRDVQEVAPGTLRCDLQRIYEGSRATPTPLTEAAKDGTLEAWCKVRAQRVKSDPWFYLCRWRLFLAFLGLPHAWADPAEEGAEHAPQAPEDARPKVRAVQLNEVQNATSALATSRPRKLSRASAMKSFIGAAP